MTLLFARSDAQECLRDPDPRLCVACLSLYQCMDLAEYRTLFVLSFTAPALDPDVAPSFGTLLGTINVALSMLGEVGAVCDDDSTSAPPPPPPHNQGALTM